MAEPAAGHTSRDGGTDLALRITVPAASAEVVGAFLMDLLGPFEEEGPHGGDLGDAFTLVFYPGAAAEITLEEIVAALPSEMRALGSRVLTLEAESVSREWVDGWRAYFHPVVIGAVGIRPPWEPRPADDRAEGVVDVVINPGLGFGTGLHPTTGGVLELLQAQETGKAAGAGGAAGRRSGPLVDVGTGSGVLAIAAAKLGWGPIVAFDNDVAALESARGNVVANGVEDVILVREIGLAEAPEAWFEGATVLANLTLEPVLVLLGKLGTQGAHPARVVVSGILAGSQEQEVLRMAREAGFVLGGGAREDEWVSLEFMPARPGGGGKTGAGSDAPPGAGPPAPEGRG